jgi:hypothetical protein
LSCPPARNYLVVSEFARVPVAKSQSPILCRPAASFR